VSYYEEQNEGVDLKRVLQLVESHIKSYYAKKWGCDLPLNLGSCKFDKPFEDKELSFWQPLRDRDALINDLFGEKLND